MQNHKQKEEIIASLKKFVNFAIFRNLKIKNKTS